MQSRRTFTLVIAAAAVICGLTDPADAVNVGNTPGGPPIPLVVNSGPFGGTPSFLLVANVTYDPSADNLFKDFTNTSAGTGGSGSGILSGQNVPIDETFFNSGTDTWIAWTERVVSRSTPNGSDPGFLFDDQTPITVKRNGLILTQGVDYTLSTMFSGPPGNNGYEEITINLAPSSYIQPSDSIDIQKQIHEVFGDGNVWALGEAARVAQYPTPVPAPTTLALFAVAGVAPLLRRRRR